MGRGFPPSIAKSLDQLMSKAKIVDFIVCTKRPFLDKITNSCRHLYFV